MDFSVFQSAVVAKADMSVADVAELVTSEAFTAGSLLMLTGVDNDEDKQRTLEAVGNLLMCCGHIAELLQADLNDIAKTQTSLKVQINNAL